MFNHTGTPNFNSFSRVKIKQFFSGFISNITSLTNTRVNLMIYGAVARISKTTLNINPRVDVRGEKNILIVFMYQFLRLITPVLLSISFPAMKVIMRERIRPKGTNLIVTSANINANILCKQYNHIYNVSGSTINDVKNLTLNQFNYTVV